MNAFAASIRSGVLIVVTTLLLPGSSVCQPPTRQKTPADDAAVLVETVKLAAGWQLYLTHENVVMLSELRIFDLHTASQLAKMLAGAVDPLDDLDKQLAKVAALKSLSNDDAATIARLRKIIKILKEQGEALQAYWDTGVEENIKRYGIAQKAAMKEISELLDLEPKKGIAPPPREATKKP